jgi:adenylate cyclase
MKTNFEYTTLANRYTARFPGLTYIGTQVNFWVVANMLLATIMFLQSRIISQAFDLAVPVYAEPIFRMAIILGIVSGVCLGIVGYYLDRKFLRMQSLGKIIVLKTIASLGVIVILVILIRYVFFDSIILASPYLHAIALHNNSWKYVLLLLLVYYFFMTLLISFINQVNKKYGPGVLLPLLFGRYRTPKEEERIFMFMDLKSSTATAEKLGHLKYSSFIRDCFSDINEVLFPFRAQVYQYVGDEIVVTWPEHEGLKYHFCINFYFACKNQFSLRAQYYLTNYGLVPEFKAGLHSGMVTAVEIGELKRDIAYHGDTLNTAARIQSVCNEYGKSFIASGYLIDKTGLPPGVSAEPLGQIILRGKAEKVRLVSLSLQE